MICEDFDRLWNERLDARDAAVPEVERALETHASGCEPCRAAAARYELLRQALLAWGPSPAPPAGFVERVLAAHEHEGRRPRTLPIPRGARWAAAAVLLLGMGLAIRVATHRAGQPANAPLAAKVPVPRPLSAALADAASATIDLARTTSEPAARVGRRVLATSLPAELAAPAPLVPVADALPTLGDDVQRGVQPLSGTARRAFGFLIGPAWTEKPAKAERREGEA
jgi:hypothetical protein